MIELDDLNSFLKFGYFQNYEQKDYDVDLSGIDKEYYQEYPESELKRIGIDFFREAIADDYDANQQHVIPLSGGLDSRALLSGLLECTEASNIHTYTFGIPGSLDFEIGSYVAKKAGTKHENFSLKKYKYTQDELLDISKRVNCQTMLFHHPPVWEIDKYYKDFTVWSGYLGDLVAGEHQPKFPTNDIQKAKEDYVNKRSYSKSIKLHNNTEKDFMNNVSNSFISPNKLSYEEQLIFKERGNKWTAPHVLMKGYNYKTPLINNRWMNFMLSIASNYREKENLFIKIMLDNYPTLFNLKTKTNSGLPLTASSSHVFLKRAFNKMRNNAPFVSKKNVNYLDFDKAFREREDLRVIVKNNIYDLIERNLITWLDIEEIYNEHMNGKGNYSDALIVLVSLEIHFKNMES